MTALPISYENMAPLVDTLPLAAHVRDMATNQYVLANDHYSKNQGFRCVDEVISLTSADLYQHRRQRLETLQGCLTLEATYQASIEQANQQIVKAKQSGRFKLCTLFPTGFIYVCILHKVPLVDAKEQVSAIVSFSQEVTAYMDLVSLYRVYKKHYPIKLASIQFLNYLNIRGHFCILPTPQEIFVLLVLCQDPRVKYVAHQLQLSPRTVEAYKLRLRDKLKISFSLEQLLVKLRQPLLTLKRLPYIDDMPYFTKKGVQSLDPCL